MKKKTAAQLAWEAQKQAWTSQGGVQVSSTQKTTAAQNAWNSAKNNPDYIQRARQQITKVKTAAQPTEKIETFDVKRGNLTGEANGRSGRSQKERQERLSGKQMAYQMQKESGVVPGKKQEEEPERPSFSASYQEKEDWFNQKIGQAAKKEEEPKEENPLSMSYWEGRVNSALEQTEQKKETKGGRIQKPSADHYDAEQIRQYKEQEIGDYKKVLDEQNTLADTLYKEFQTAEQAVKDAQEAYEKNPNGVTRMRYLKAFDTYQKAREPLSTAVKRSEELANEVNAMIGSYQNQYDDNTRYAGKDYAGMQAYITELADRLDQTGPEEKNAETGQNLREQYQEEIDRATNYSYSMMDMEQLQAEYDRLNRQREELYKPVGPQYRYQATGADRQAAEDRKAEQEKTGEKMRLVQKAMNEREADDAKAAYESYAAGKAEKPTVDLAGQNLIDVFEEMVNGRKGYKTAGETTEIALRDQVERNMKHLPENAKEVMLQFLEDKDYVSAANYYKAYESTMTANYANAQYAELKDWASQNFGTALGGSIGAGVAGAATPAGAWIDNTFNAINNKLVDVTGEGEYRFSDVNSDMYRGARTAAALQEGVQAYNATTGKWEDALNLASGALTSSVQNVVQFALFGSASLPFMAASAAGQSAYQGLKSGLSEEQAAVTSTVSGLIEYMTEKLPLEHLLDKINTIGEGGVVTVKQIAEMIRKQGMEEASEEVVGNIADNLFDMWYNKDNSEFRQYSAQLQREGMSKAEADMEAFGKFFVGDSIEAAAAAYLSTFLLIGGNVASANMQAAQYGKEMKAGEAFKGTQYTVDEMNTVLLAQQIPGEYAGGRYAAEQLKNQVLEGKQLSNRLLGFAAMTNNQVIKDASKYLNQALEMGPETQSFKMAAAMVGQYDVGSQLPSKAFVESLKSQIEADKEATKQQKTKAKSAQTTTGETLSHYQTVFAENGVGIRDAKNRTEVMNKLILGQSVSDAELRKLHMGAKLTKQMLYELTGVEIPEGVVKEKDLMQYYRSARDGFEAKIKAEAQERTAQDEQAAAEQQRAFEAEQMRQMDIADRVVEATKSDVDERLQYFIEHGKLKETEKGAENGQTGEAVLRGTGGRVDGQSDGGADAAAAGNAEADTRGTEGQNRSGDAGVSEEVRVRGRGNAVSSRDFGLKNATTLKTAREVLQEDETEPMRKFREDVKAKYGYDVVYTDGDFVQRQDGRDVIVRGLFDQESKRLFVNANYFRLSYDQIGNHEVFHIEVSNGDVDLQAMAEAFNEATGNKEILASLVNQYMEKLALDDYNSALEEVFADMNGKFNGIRSVNVTAYQDIFEQIKAASPKNGEAASSMQKNSVESFGDGKQYVKADRQVIFGNDRDSWSTQLEDYINGKIRRGQDVTLIGADGDELILTATSAGKLSSPYTSDGRTMSETAFERKANAAAHIDELAQISTRGKKTVSDAESRHGDMASEGWNYRTAYFMDFDGKYYRVTISVAQGADGKMIYNIGQMKEEASPKVKGSSAETGNGPRGFASSENSIRNGGENVKQKNSEVVDEADRKAAQFAIIRDSNAADDAYHTWIRSAAEIKTLSETLADPEWAEYDEYDPDYTRQMAEDAVRTGKITVYSSYKIGNGVFVTPSRMEAESYSGNGKVYSKTVNVADVAWIDPTQGQYAPTNTADIRYSQEADEEYRRLAENPRENHAALQKMVDAAASEAGYTKKAYHGTDGDFWTFSLRNRGKNGEMLGVGYYFAEHEADAANYARGGGKVLPVYLDIQNPVSTTKLTITPEQWGKFLDYAQAHRDEYIDGAWKGNSIKKDFELRYMNDYDSDTDLIAGFINATAGRNSEVAEAYLQMLKDSTGIDGVVQGEGEGKVYVAFTPEQIKSAEIVTRNDSGDVIPLSERFNASKGDIRYSIDSDMTEDERYRELRGKTVAVTPEAKYTDEQLASIHTLEQLNAKAKSKAEKVIRPLAESLGILNRSMKTPDVEIDFTFSKNKGLRESMSKQLRYGGTYADFAKALVNLDGILENAVLIEQHKDKYAGTTRANNQLKSVSVLVGVFRDGDSLIPTQIEIKDTSNAGGILYMTVTMTKIEAGVMAGASAQRRTPPYVVPASEIETGVLGSGAQKNWRGRSLIPISNYNLAEIFANVNPADGHFLKYVPDGFLNDAQKAAKQSAIREDENRIQSYRQKNSVDTDLMDVWREQNPGQTAVTQEGFDEAQRTLLDRYRNDTVLKTAYDSVGAAKNSNETQTKTSRARTNTFEKLFSEAEKSMDGLKKEDMTYDVIREKESLEGAAARLAQDFDGEVDDLLKRTDWTGEDIDTAMGALSVFREEAQKNGDYSKVVEMAQKIRENATKGGQFVQAFAKYNRTTPEGLLVKAIDEVDKAKNPVQRKNVNPVVQAMIDSYTEQIRDLRAEQKQAVQDAKLAGQMGQGKADAAELRKIRERYENQIKALNEQRDKLLADAVQAGRESQKKADNAAMKRITDAYNKRIDEWQKKIDLAKAAYDEMFQKGQTQQQQTDARAQERKIQKFEDMLAKLQAERDEILNGGLDALRATNKGISDAKANEITKNLTEMADALDAVKEGDVDALIDVIQRQAKIRKTPVSKATLNNLKKQNFEWLWNAASTQYLQIAKDYVKPSMARRVATYQTMSHLFNKRTGMRNVVSNLAFSAVEAAANDISQIPDMVLGAITGKRGVGFDQAIFSKANWEGFMEGYSKVQPELALDIETAENGKYGTGRRTNKMTGNLLSRNLSRVERLLGYELNLTDEVTKGSIRAETIRQLQGFVDSGKMTMEEAIQAAEQEMLYRTFQDDTLVGTTLSQLKKLGNLVGFGDSGQKIGGLTVHEFGLGDLLTKYTQVPGALVHRSIEFTPAGYAKAIYALVMAQKNGGVKNMSALQQRNIALAIGRATTGSGLIALFAALTKAGIILNADDEDDPDAKALRAAGGISGTQINVDALGRLIRGESADLQDGDELWGIEFMQPVNGLMTIGALLNNSKEGQNLAQRWLEAILNGTVQSIDDLSVMNTLRTIQNALEYSQEESALGKAKDVLLELAKSSATGFIPSLVRQFAQGMDAYYRDAYGSKNPLVQGKEQIMNAIPGLRQKLPTKLTNFGEDKSYGGSTVQRWMNAFFTPGSVRTYQADDTVQELLDLYYASGNEKIIPAKSAPYKIQVGNERYEMSAEERREYQTTMGQTAKLWMEQFFDSDDYADMTTEERAAQVEKIVKSAEDVAKNKVAGAMGIDNAKVFDQGITVETTRLGLAGESGVSPSLPDSKSIGDPDRTGYKYELTNEELKQWEDLYNGAYTKEVGDVIQSDAYAKADDAEKADMIRDAKETAKNAAKDEFLEALQSVGIRAELDESSDFYEIRKNVTEGTSIEKTVKRLKSDGASENSISSAITSTIKDGYLNGDFNEKTANKKLVQYGAAKDENDAYWKIREWEGGEDYKKYDRFYASVENGKKLDDTISYYTSHGVESKTLKSQITSHFKPLYLSASVQERQYMKEYLLDAYGALGVSRNKAAKNIDKWLEE
nr:MAG TPA: MAEBL protein [Caudoviricetes sp.]